MGILAAAIAAVILVACFLSYSQAYAEIYIETSPDKTEPHKTVSIRVSAIIEPNSAKDVVLRIAPPNGPSYDQQMHLEADALGFATSSVEYPTSFSSSDTQQTGNYTIFVQDVQTAELLGRNSFEVTDSEALNFTSKIPEQIFLPLTVLAAGGGLTYWYNRLSSKREKQNLLNQRKAELFLTLRPHYAHITRSLRNLANELKRKEKAEKLYCFYCIVVYVRERSILLDKMGAYFLNDIKGEEEIANVEGRILDSLYKIFTLEGYSELGRLLSKEQTFNDLSVELGKSYTASELFEKFKTWADTQTWEDHSLLRDLDLIDELFKKQRQKMFRDWYSKDSITKKFLEVMGNKSGDAKDKKKDDK